jgi:hypothetical protein
VGALKIPTSWVSTPTADFAISSIIILSTIIHPGYTRIYTSTEAESTRTHIHVHMRRCTVLWRSLYNLYLVLCIYTQTQPVNTCSVEYQMAAAIVLHYLNVNVRYI